MTHHPASVPSTLDDLFKQPIDLLRCLSCVSSLITLHSTYNQTFTLYDSQTASTALPLKAIALPTRSQPVQVKVSVLNSERWVSDLHFAKEGRLYHRLINTGGAADVKVKVQEYLPRWMRPWISELRVETRENEGEEVQVVQIGKNQIGVKYDEESNCLITI